MHPFLYPEFIEALRDDRIRYRRFGHLHEHDRRPSRRGPSDY